MLVDDQSIEPIQIKDMSRLLIFSVLDLLSACFCWLATSEATKAERRRFIFADRACSERAGTAE